MANQNLTPTQAQKIKVEEPPNIREVIYQALLEEFQYDLARWSAEIERASLTVRFHNPAIFFSSGQTVLNQQYQVILTEFFPRYVNLLKRYDGVIETLGIEGHTSSEWQGSLSQDEIYFNNMALAQARSRAVLEYCLQLPSITADKKWLLSLLSANGFSSGRLIMENGLENVEHSRRVEFRIYIYSEPNKTIITNSNLTINCVNDASH